jgi:signal transduction histidine kinase
MPRPVARRVAASFLARGWSMTAGRASLSAMDPDSGASVPAFRLWRAALRDAPCCALADRSGRLVFASRAFVEATAGEPPGKLAARLLRMLERLRDYPYEVSETVELGDRLWKATHLPIFEGNGELAGAACVLAPVEEDTAARRVAPSAPALQMLALEASIEEAERRLGAVEAEFQRAAEESRRKGAFLAMMSHELRTPLNAILGFAEMALREVRGPLPAAYRGYLEDIAAAGRHMGELVESVLDAARLENGQVSVELQPVSARLLVAEARSLIALKAEAEGVDVSRVALHGDWLLSVDPLRVRQILVNLLNNAIKFTPRGGAVGVDAMRLADDVVDLAVWDTGPGIELAHQARVFEAFYQVPGVAGRAAADKGTGLGLAISRQLARLMGGDLVLASEPGRGSRFTVRLKLVRTERVAATA